MKKAWMVALTVACSGCGGGCGSPAIMSIEPEKPKIVEQAEAAALGLIATVQEQVKSLDGMIGKVAADAEDLRGKVEVALSRVGAVEVRLDGFIPEIAAKVEALTGRTSALEARVEKLEKDRTADEFALNGVKWEPVRN